MIKGAQSGRIAVLDGWRGIAILCVLSDHLNSALGYPLGWLPSLGQHGVTIFFVLSGYLITGKLLEGGSLRRFYLRRFFRLTPVAWAFLFTAWLVGYLAHTQMIWPDDVLACSLFFRNYAGEIGRAVTMHFWSLSIEEQFYLIWPAILIFSGARRARWIAALAALASYSLLIFRRDFYLVHMTNTEIRADALLVGCWLALILQTPAARYGFRILAKWTAVPALASIAWLIVRGCPIPTLLESLAWGILIVGSAIANLKVLSFAPLAWLGRISYSAYVWNLLVVAIFYAAPLPVLLGLLIAVPAISYYAIEIPSQRMGAKISKMLSGEKSPQASNPLLDSELANES